MDALNTKGMFPRRLPPMYAGSEHIEVQEPPYCEATSRLSERCTDYETEAIKRPLPDLGDCGAAECFDKSSPEAADEIARLIEDFRRCAKFYVAATQAVKYFPESLLAKDRMIIARELCIAITAFDTFAEQVGLTWKTAQCQFPRVRGWKQIRQLRNAYDDFFRRHSTDRDDGEEGEK